MTKSGERFICISPHSLLMPMPGWSSMPERFMDQLGISTCTLSNCHLLAKMIDHSTSAIRAPLFLSLCAPPRTQRQGLVTSPPRKEGTWFKVATLNGYLVRRNIKWRLQQRQALHHFLEEIFQPGCFFSRGRGKETNVRPPPDLFMCDLMNGNKMLIIVWGCYDMLVILPTFRLQPPLCHFHFLTFTLSLLMDDIIWLQPPLCRCLTQESWLPGTASENNL